MHSAKTTFNFHMTTAIFRRWSKAFSALALAITLGFSVPPVLADSDSLLDLTEMSLEELMNIEVTSVSKKPQKVSDAAAAIFVITQEDIRRSGATSIPEALRMAPGIQVARIDSNKWAISARGFNDRFANKLLVLTDGRTVYTPLFSGVWWDVQDTLLEDIDRIEVIRGPGATLWGANAVNGVINIITKTARDTQGGLISAGGGTEERGFGSVRYGAKIGDDAYYRVYAKYFNRGDTDFVSGGDADDAWDMWRAGFRMDWDGTGGDAFTLQGDLYDGETAEKIAVPTPRDPYFGIADNDADVSGVNVMARWNRVLSSTSDMALKLYYDFYRRDYEILYEEDRHTFDVDFQHRFSWGRRYDILWGVGYHFTHDDVNNTFILSLDPDSSGDHLASGFLQNEITLKENLLHLTLGSKFEHNGYTGFEVQPTARLLYTPNSRNSVWLSISRAVRTPSRAENDIQIRADAIPPRSNLNPTFLPVCVSATGNSGLDCEELVAYEIGYRAQLKDGLSLDISAFYHHYDNLLSGEVGGPSIVIFPRVHLSLPAIGDNKMSGETYGIELAIDCRLRHWWQLKGAYSFLQMQLHPDSDSTDIWFEGDEERSPHHQVSLRSTMDLPRNLELDLWFRYVDSLPAGGRKGANPLIAGKYRTDVKSYFTLGVRLGWKPTKNLELALAGQNLLDGKHPEFSKPFFINSIPAEVERGVYGKITWRF